MLEWHASGVDKGEILYTVPVVFHKPKWIMEYCRFSSVPLAGQGFHTYCTILSLTLGFPDSLHPVSDFGRRSTQYAKPNCSINCIHLLICESNILIFS